MDDRTLKHRELLQDLGVKSQEAYDKAVLTLSGGSLMLSFVFVSDIIGDKPICLLGWLIAAWISWTLSVSTILFSFYSSKRAFDKAVSQLDAGQQTDKHLGGISDKITTILNIFSGGLFILGVICICLFVGHNIG